MRDRNGRTLEYLNKSEAEYGINSQIQENASNTMYFEHGENPAFGRGDQYTRNKEEEKEFKPKPLEDSSGRSESSEGGIANH